MMTEDEARERWCPFVQWTAGNDTYHPNNNRDESHGDGSKMSGCIASECMAWRWDEYPDQGEPQTGFCGLAGKP